MTPRGSKIRRAALALGLLGFMGFCCLDGHPRLQSVAAMAWGLGLIFGIEARS